MDERADSGSAKFFWPKFAKMIEWNLDGHTVLLARSVWWIERSALDVIPAGLAATYLVSVRAVRAFAERPIHLRPKIARIAMKVTAAQISANHSPCLA